MLPADGAVQIQVTVGGPDEGGRRTIEVYARPGDAGAEGPWTRHASGLLAPAGPSGAGRRRASSRCGRRREPLPVDIEGLYEALAAAGYGYGPVFRGLRAAWRRGPDIFAEVALPPRTPRRRARSGCIRRCLTPPCTRPGWTGPAPSRVRSGCRSPGRGCRCTRRARRCCGSGCGRTPAEGCRSRPLTAPARRWSRWSRWCPGRSRRPAGSVAGGRAARGTPCSAWSGCPSRSRRRRPGGRWAVTGADPLGLVPGLVVAGADVRAHASLADLAGGLRRGWPGPRCGAGLRRCQDAGAAAAVDAVAAGAGAGPGVAGGGAGWPRRGWWW